MTPLVYKDLAKKTYSEDSFKRTVENLLPMIMEKDCEDMPKELLDRLVSGMKNEYDQAYNITVDCLEATYSEPEAYSLLEFYTNNEWVIEKQSGYAVLSMERMMNEFAPGLAERIIEEYEKDLEEAEDDSIEIV